MSLLRVCLFAGEDAYLQPVFGQWYWTRRIRVERARRVVGLVEIEHGRSVIFQVRVKESSSVVGLFSARAIAEDEPEALRPRRHRPQTDLLPFNRKLHDAFTLHHVFVAQLVRRSYFA